MDSQLISINYSDPLWIAIAFICGFLMRLLGLPPLIGFLVAGFVLNNIGVKGGEFLNEMADLGITLLLFSIGLKLKLKALAKPEVWAVASLHMIALTLFIALAVFLFSFSGIQMLTNIGTSTALLIGFAMSFSSTVFAVKVIDELGATGSRHGQTAIGVLVVQDIAAVIFIAVSIGKVPSPLAFFLIALIPLRHLLYKVLDKVGHGELLILFGITLALVGSEIFELVGIKGDVGALVIGMLFARHSKSKELSRALMGFKELFLVGFFLSVGLVAVPGWTEILVAMFFIMLLPVKVGIYFILFNLFHLRASTSWRTSFNLANYSEFGLIVGALASTSGWFSNQLLTVFSVVISFSFIVSAPLINVRDSLYQKWRPFLKKFEKKQRLPGEENLDLSHIKLVVFGMGRMGTAAYTSMEPNYPGKIVGVEIEHEKIKQHLAAGRNVVNGDATNPDFWVRAPDLIKDLDWVLLSLPNHKANMVAVSLLKEMGYKGHIAATSKFPDEEIALKEIGVEYTFNIYTSAGLGFANELQNFVVNRPVDV